MKSIVFFNNKGGVGKTTLTCNVVSFLNKHKGLRVLLVDADPQCNATQAILDDEICEQIYLNEAGESKYGTLFDMLCPIEAGETAINNTIAPILASQNFFQTDIIPGHPKMSLVEDKLSSGWGDLMAGTPSGFRVTNWCSQLFEKYSPHYDLIVFDVGPSLGALNRTILLSCDYLVTPFGCDIFSLLGIQNIASWMITWKRSYDRAIEFAKADRPEILTYPVVSEVNERSRFVGYSVQQYITKSFKTGKRPVKAYELIMSKIPETVNTHLAPLKANGISDADFELGHIPFLYSLVPLAQSERSPIHSLKDSGRLVGSQFQQVQDYAAVMNAFCDKLIRNIGLE